MHNRLTRSQTLAIGSVVTVLGLVAVARTVTAFNPQPDPPGFGMVGIAEGQTARINLVNLGSADPQLPPDPCRAELQFFDADGNVLARSRVRLKPGQSASLDYVASFVPANGDVALANRAEIRGALTTEDGLLPPPCKSTVEIFDNQTGRTTVLLAPPCRGNGAHCQGQP